MMKNLEIGDKVLVGDAKYEAINAFAHNDKSTEASFLQIHAGRSCIDITEEHLLHANAQVLAAKFIQVGY